MTTTRLRTYARDYALETWGITLRRITADEVLTMEIRSDGYANAHVEGEHESNGLCSFTSPRECGERMAASEFVETTDGLSVPHTAQSQRTVHGECAHPATKAARAACRRASAPVAIEEN